MAVLESTTIKPQGYFCFQFYYYMLGKDAGTLRIALRYTKNSSNANTEDEQKVIWELSSQNCTKSWQRGLVAVSSVQTFQV